MSVSSADTSPPAPAAEEAPTQDGWRNGGLTALRAELDSIDDAIHDLLIRRAEVVEHVARSGKPAAFRPGREASMLRRLLGRHRGALPPATLVRVWREMLAGTTAMQGGFSLAVSDSDPGAPLCQLAREHFGALTPLRVHGGPGQALAEVSQGRASVAVLPYPSETHAWWVSLMHHAPRLHIIAQLPFWAPRPDGTARVKALVVGMTAADASGNDRSLLGLECEGDISPTRLSKDLTGAGLKPESLVLRRSAGSPVANILVEVNGYLADDDPRLNRPGSVLRRAMVLGRYAVLVGEERLGAER